MNVIDYIPVGRKEAPVSREELCRLTGSEDRTVRREINRAKRTYPIVNVGLGYYIADDPDDPNLREYIMKEMHRIKEISKGLKRHKALYKVNKEQETLNV